MSGRFHRRGASALEFALVCIALVPLVLFTMDFSWYLFKKNTLEQCTRDAVRAGSDMCDPANTNTALGSEGINCVTEGDPQSTAEDRFDDCWSESGLGGTASATVSFSGNSGTYTRAITVTSTVTHAPFTGNLGVPTSIDTQLTYLLDDQAN